MSTGHNEDKLLFLQLLKLAADRADTFNMYSFGLQVGFSLRCLIGAVERQLLREGFGIPPGVSPQRNKRHGEVWYSGDRLPGVSNAEHEELVKILEDNERA